MNKEKRCKSANLKGGLRQLLCILSNQNLAHMRSYLIIEHFRPETIKALYERFDEKGRMLPEGVNYLHSWINEDVSLCYQVMESESLELLQSWIAKWEDLADFEVVPVISSGEAKAKVLGIQKAANLADIEHMPESVLEDAKKAEAGKKTISIYENMAKEEERRNIASEIKREGSDKAMIKKLTGLNEEEIDKL